VKLADRNLAGPNECKFVDPVQAGGGLPILGCLRPEEGTVLIDGGLDVGLPDRGTESNISNFER
jgi:hypothetical protein